ALLGLLRMTAVCEARLAKQICSPDERSDIRGSRSMARPGCRFAHPGYRLPTNGRMRRPINAADPAGQSISFVGREPLRYACGSNLAPAMNILSIQSHVAYGHVGNAAATFPLQRIGVEVWPIHTVQFSNHTGYGAWTGQVFDAGLITDLVRGIAER